MRLDAQERGMCGGVVKTCFGLEVCLIARTFRPVSIFLWYVWVPCSVLFQFGGVCFAFAFCPCPEDQSDDKRRIETGTCG